MYEIDPNDMPTPELKDLVRKTNDMARTLFGRSITVRVHKYTYWPWRVKITPPEN